MKTKMGGDPTLPPLDVKLPVRSRNGSTSLACWRGDCGRCEGAGADVVHDQVVVATEWTCGHRCHQGGQ